MATKLKNRFLYIPILTLAILSFSLSILSAYDIVYNKEYLSKDCYFKSYSYAVNLINYAENVQIMITDFNDYPQKSQDSKLAELKKKYTNVDEKDLQKIIESNDANYNEMKTSLNSEKALKYYVKDTRNNKIYTNIEGSVNIDDFIKEEAVYTDNFPTTNKLPNYFQNVNQWFQKNNLQGSFIFVKSADGFSQMTEDYKYYNSIRERILKEVIICISSLSVGTILLLFLRIKFSESNKIQSNIKSLYISIPIDAQAFIFLLYSFAMFIYLSQVSFFYSPIGIRHFQKLFFVAIYIYYFMGSAGSILRLIQNKDKLKATLHSSILYQVCALWKESLNNKENLFRELLLFSSTVLFGVFSAVGFIAFERRSHKEFILIAFIYASAYMLLVPLYLLRRAVVIDRIIKGTNAITSGNLDYTMEATGDVNYKIIAENINSMKESFKKSVDDQVRSERMKTELITNVSHDLRTPLTSIINYVSLLKKGGISKEDTQKYIEVLDQKSQRLRILIEDLFEASKVSSGSIELFIEKVDITSLLRQALGEFDEKINKSPLTFKTNIPVEEIYLNLDGKRTWRVFENLISNALKYSLPGSRVFIDLIEKEATVEVIIKNMSSYELDFDVDEIFERFKRGDKARSTEGSGLGLSIAKSIVELQGGHMKIDIDGDLFKVTTVFEKSNNII